ncbi:MAG: MBL fold metallo-hydrolase [Phycisphaerales bacterium]|nr:MBL fold metallo-hydrolase [Phycisphaerales bacterium]
MDLRIVSIGTLAAHPLWDERGPVRTGHATTTLVQSEGANILIDPGLPAPALNARLSERTKLRPKDITHVFLTSFNPECRRGIELFDRAKWLLSEKERETIGVPLATSLARLAETRDMAESSGEEFGEDQQGMLAVLQRDVAILARCEAAADSIAPGVDLFPLPGFSAGLCGVLVNEPTRTTLVCGDAIPTLEHLMQGKVLPTCADREQALESYQEAVEIADVLVLGRDNLVMSPTKRGIG